MKVSEAVAALQALPQDVELLDEDAQTMITGFYGSDYNDGDGDHDYVAYTTEEAL